MASKNKNLSQHTAVILQAAGKYKIGLAVSEYNEAITVALKQGAEETLLKYGVKPKNIFVTYAPGAYELPLVAKWLQQSKKLDAVICLGCVVKGDTEHDVYINHAVAKGLMDLNLETGAPFVFGLLTTNNMQQATDRAGGKHGNKGVECAVAALKMLSLKNDLKK